MLIFIRDFKKRHREFLDVFNADMSRRFVLHPFPGNSVGDIAVAQGKLHCLAYPVQDTESRSYTTELSIFDAGTGAEIRRVNLPFQAYTITYLPRNDLFAIQFMDRSVHFLDPTKLEVVWSATPLHAPTLSKAQSGHARALEYPAISSDTRPFPPGSVEIGGRLFEDRLGKIRGVTTSHRGERTDSEIMGRSTGIFSFDVATKTHAFHPVEFSPWDAPSLFAPSPDGQYVLRQAPHWEIGADFDTGHDPEKNAWMIERHFLDLWRVEDQTPVKRLHVGDIPASVFIGNLGQKAERLGLSNSTTEASIRKAASWSQSSLDPFRLPSGMPPGADRLNSEYHDLRDLKELRRNQRQDICWEPNSQAFWFASRYSLRRIQIDGTRSPLLFIGHFLNDAHRALLGKRPPGTDIGVGEAYPSMALPLMKAIKVSHAGIEISFHNEIIIRIPNEILLSDAPMVFLNDDMISINSLPKLTATEIASNPNLIRY